MLTGTYNNKFGILKFARIVFSLGAIVLAGCSSQEVYVYEKLPEASECRRYTDYWTVSACNRKHQIKMNEKLESVIRTTNYHLSRKYNQRDKCKERKYRSASQGCYISHLPSRANLPTFGKTADWRLQPFPVIQNSDSNSFASYCPASELCEVDLVLFPRNYLYFIGSFTDRVWGAENLSDLKRNRIL